MRIRNHKLHPDLVPLFRKANKYQANRSACLSGHQHASALEARYCTTLELLRRAGEIKSFETQKRFDLVVNGEKICSHYVDFWVEGLDGEWQAHETKGMATAVWDIKRKLFEALNPSIQYIVIK